MTSERLCPCAQDNCFDEDEPEQAESGSAPLRETEHCGLQCPIASAPAIDPAAREAVNDAPAGAWLLPVDGQLPGRDPPERLHGHTGF